MKLASLFTAASLAVGVLCSSLDPPTFTKIYDGNLIVDQSRGVIPGHTGKRWLLEFKGGNLTDPHTGKLAATWENIGGQFGTIFENQFAHSAIDFVLKWADDHTYVHGKIVGCGTVADGIFSYVQFDTSSPSRQDWQDNFFMFHMNGAGDSPVKPIAFYKMDMNWIGKINTNNTCSTGK